MAPTVTLITGPTAIDASGRGRRRCASDRPREMHRAVLAAVPQADALVMAAAVANYTPDQVATQKIAHDDGDAQPCGWRRRRTFWPTSWPGAPARAGPTPLLVGFAAETHDVVERARAKRLRKGIDVIVANDVSRSDSGLTSTPTR